MKKLLNYVCLLFSLLVFSSVVSAETCPSTYQGYPLINVSYMVGEARVQNFNSITCNYGHKKAGPYPAQKPLWPPSCSIPEKNADWTMIPDFPRLYSCTPSSSVTCAYKDHACLPGYYPQ